MKVENIDWGDLNKYKSNLCLPREQWITMDDVLCGSYEISSYGRLRRKPCEGHASLANYKVYSISDNGNGYKKFAISKGGKCFNFYAHRLVATYFIPNPLGLPQVNHKPCGLGKFDNRVENLEWCTPSMNIRDAHLNNQMSPRSSLGKLRMLSDEMVKKAYTDYKECGKVGETARKYDIPRTTFSSIVNKKSRRVITDEIDLAFTN